MARTRCAALPENARLLSRDPLAVLGEPMPTAAIHHTGGEVSHPTGPHLYPHGQRMAYAEQSPARMRGPINEHASALAHEWRRLTRAATAVALLTAPAFFLVLYESNHLSLIASLIITVLSVLVFRGLVEVVARKLIPSPSLYGADQSLRDEDMVARRRYWWWRTRFRRLPYWIGAIFLLLLRCPVLPLARRRQRAVLQPDGGHPPDLPARRSCRSSGSSSFSSRSCSSSTSRSSSDRSCSSRCARSAATSRATRAGA